MFSESSTISLITVYSLAVKIASGVFALVTGVNLILFVHNVITQLSQICKELQVDISCVCKPL